MDSDTCGIAHGATPVDCDLPRGHHRGPVTDGLTDADGLSISDADRHDDDATDALADLIAHHSLPVTDRLRALIESDPDGCRRVVVRYFGSAVRGDGLVRRRRAYADLRRARADAANGVGHGPAPSPLNGWGAFL